MSSFLIRASFAELILACTAFLLGLNLLWSAVGVWIEASAYGRSHRVWALPRAPGQLRWEILANLRFDVIAGTAVASLLASGAVRVAPASLASTALTFAACWLSFEIYYWLLHRALHSRHLFRFHRYHHDSRVTTAFTGLSMSTVETVGWVIGFALAPVALSRIAPISVEGWALYFLWNYSGNIVGHVNAEFLPRSLARRSQSWLMHPIVYHALHHARFINHYSFGSSFMDRLCGTEWPDWQALFLRVRAGEPLTRMGQRG